MRAMLVVSLVALIGPAAVLAQTAPPPSAAPAPPGTASPPSAPPARASPGTGSTRGGDISREEYVQRAMDRARRAAEARFDRMDANHDGILTADERRSYREQRRPPSPQ